MHKRFRIPKSRIFLKKGQVLLFLKYSDYFYGEPTDKLIVVLNQPPNDEDYIIVLTTSKQRAFLDQLGCQTDCYLLGANQDCFKEKTWIVFKTTQYRSKKDLVRLIKKKRLIIKECLDSTTVKYIVNCMEKSTEIIAPKIIKDLLNTQ